MILGQLPLKVPYLTVNEKSVAFHFIVFSIPMFHNENYSFEFSFFNCFYNLVPTQPFLVFFLPTKIGIAILNNASIMHIYLFVCFEVVLLYEIQI